MTYNHNIKYLLGIQICQDRHTKTLTLTQAKYIIDLLSKLNMMNYHLVNTFLTVGMCYIRDTNGTLTLVEATFMSIVPYSEALGSLQYLVTMT